MTHYLAPQNLSDILQDFTEPHYGRYSSDVRHQNGTYIPVWYFINDVVGGLDVFQVWMSVSTAPVTGSGSFTLDLSRNRSQANQSVAKVMFIFLSV